MVRPHRGRHALHRHRLGVLDDRTIHVHVDTTIGRSADPDLPFGPSEHCFRQPMSRIWDHPRMGGLHAEVLATPGGRRRTIRQGPAARPVHSHGALAGRTIRALAGCTVNEKAVVASGTDHPRTRGLMEDAGASQPVALDHPRTWGCTQVSRSTVRSDADHPRTRGLHDGDSALSFRILGSSAHARAARSPGRTTTTSSSDHPRTRGLHPST